MIADPAEGRQARAVVDSVESELTRQRVKFAPAIPIGAMIELPAAALAAAHLARVADFLSVGSNNVAQYTLAVDRTNGRVAVVYRPHHPAVCRLIAMTVKAGLAAEEARLGLRGDGRQPALRPAAARSRRADVPMAPARIGPVIELLRRVGGCPVRGPRERGPGRRRRERDGRDIERLGVTGSAGEEEELRRIR